MRKGIREYGDLQWDVTESEKGARRLVGDADPISAGWSGSRAEAASARELCWVIQDEIHLLRVSPNAARRPRAPSQATWAVPT
ncbi:hypothetical protein BHE90_013993 [Fusarium euwallaceae]|uniref:Uncharacterized protein n=1 Tax=Fusarium euwallaceae TaxID=1147111 RepID=A0A430L768_9HYPO|nr:hypothetical protein BHE90_013993 [Fusarium euwallaceae]